MKIAVIGAGPIGGYTAHLLAQAGHDVNLFEEHAEIGKPVQCTGLMTASLTDIIKPKKEFMINTTERIEIFSPNGSKLEIKSKEYIVDRTLFDSYFVNLARDSGTKLNYNHRFLKKENGALLFKDRKENTTKTTKADITIGADGPLSTVAKEAALFGLREFYYGIQARVNGNFDQSAYQVFFGNKIAPELFAWIVPESPKIARVGLGTKKDTNLFFQKFMKQHNFKAIDMQAGPIPVHSPKIQTQNKAKNTYILGDAATQVKATTLGGLIPGLKAAECLSQAITKNRDYQQLWKKRIGKSLWLHLKIRRLMDKFSDQDWNLLIRTLNNEKSKAILEKYDREKPFKLLSIILTQPKLLFFLKHALAPRKSL